MGKGSNLEGKSLEIGGLIQQDTDGSIEHIRKKTTYESDGGVDWERVIDSKVNYEEYIKQLKKSREEDNNGSDK